MAAIVAACGGRVSEVEPAENEPALPAIEGLDESEVGFPMASAAVVERTLRIQAELAESADLPEWAGEYYRGDGLGTNVSLTLAPGSGFTQIAAGCLGLQSEAHGMVKMEGGQLRLTSATDGAPNTMSWAEYVPVTWGERRFLVPPDQLVDFGDATHQDWKGTDKQGVHVLYLCRVGDEARAVFGEPQAAPEFAHLLAAADLSFSVVDVVPFVPGDGATSDYGYLRVRLDGGSDHGLAPGRRLYPEERALRFALRATVEAVTEQSCMALIRCRAVKADEMRRGLNYRLTAE